MALFPQDALNPGVRKREVFGWAMYDFANSGYTTVVLTAVFNSYFVGVVAKDAAWATLAWTLTLALSSLIVMAAMPAIGAFADMRASKKKVLVLATVGCVAATLLLATVGRGDLALAVLLIVLSNTFYSIGESMTASVLPELAKPDAMGRVSGWGWSFGYLGGMLSLGLSLAYVLSAQARGEPATSFVPVTMLITAGVYGLASLATFVLLRERAVAQPQAAGSDGLADSWQRLKTTVRASQNFSDFRWLLACGACYQAGISVVIALAAIYAEQTLGFKQADTMALIFLVNIAAALGAFAFGYGQDRIGHKLALGVTLVGWVVMTVTAALAQTATLFWVAAVIAGLCMGSSQSAGRAMVGLFAPQKQLGEFFGLWTFATRLAAIVGPITYGIVTVLTAGNHRIAIVSTALFFLLGLLLLAPVNVERGAQAAREAA